MNSAPVYGLVCAGGGAHGAYQVGVLKYVHEHFCDDQASPFRVFSGTSAGSLSTSFFASRSFDAHASHRRLEQMWLDFHVPAYHGNVLRNSVRNLLKQWARPRRRRRGPRSLLDASYLHDVVRKGFDRACFERSLEQGTTLGLAVSATELRSSRLVWFQEGPAATSWVAPESIGIETRLEPDHISASCSVPIAFPPLRIGEHDYADGGVANKRPFTPAINMGATRILSIATDQPLPQTLPEYAADFQPHFGDTIKMLLDQLGRDGAAEQAFTVEILNYFRELVSAPEPQHEFPKILLGTDVDLSEYRPVEIFLFAPSRRIRYTDVFDPDLFEQALKTRSTSLLFHQKFIRRLIDFGYADAGARHAELREFFERDRPQRTSRFTGRRGPSQGGTARGP